MHVKIFRLLLCVVVFLTAGHDCHQWSSHFAPGTVKYVCSGDTAMLPWTVAMNSGESIHDIQWHFQGPSSSNTETIAFYASGLFIPGPGYAQRISYIPNAGIMLNGLTTADAGTYTVEVTGRNSTQMWSLNHQGSLQVIDNGAVSSSQLQVVQLPKAVYDNSTGEWMVDLTCGDFSFPTQPPFDVQWTNPSGNIKPSSHYENGKFHLYLTDQEISGQYSCDVASNAMCSSSPNTTNAHASLQVNEHAARLSILEAQFKRGSTATKIAKLAAQNAKLKNTTSILYQQNTFLKAVTGQLQKQRDLLLQENANLTQKLSALEKRLNEIKNTGIPDNSTAGCAGLHRKLLVLDIYLNQSALKLQRELEAMNGSFSTRNIQCREAKKNLESVAVQLVLQNPMYNLFTLKQSLEILNNSLQNSQRNETKPNTQSQIIFDAKDTNFHHYIAYDHNIVMDDVKLNKGNGYNPNTGCFTAGKSGFYMFMGSVRIGQLQDQVRLYLTVDGQKFMSGRFGHDHEAHQGTVHAVVHLHHGRHACLRANEDLYPVAAGFSGFLIQQDH